MNSEMELAERLRALAARVSELERLEAGRFSGARVYNNAALTIANNTLTTLTFNSERFDTDAYHNTGSNTERLVAPADGRYLISGVVSFVSNATGNRILAISYNNTTSIDAIRVNANATNVTILSVATIYYLAAGDYVTLRAFQNSGGSLDVEAQSAYSPEFMIARLG